MKIKTRLKLNIWFSLCLTIFVLLSLGWAGWEVYRTEQNANLFMEIERGALEHTILTNDWMLNRGDRAITQWHANVKALKELLNSASRELAKEKIKDVLRSAIDDFETTSALMHAAIDKYKKEEHAAQGNPGFTENESR